MSGLRGKQNKKKRLNATKGKANIVWDAYERIGYRQAWGEGSGGGVTMLYQLRYREVQRYLKEISSSYLPYASQKKEI